MCGSGHCMGWRLCAHNHGLWLLCSLPAPCPRVPATPRCRNGLTVWWMQLGPCAGGQPRLLGPVRPDGARLLGGHQVRRPGQLSGGADPGSARMAAGIPGCTGQLLTAHPATLLLCSDLDPVPWVPKASMGFQQQRSLSAASPASRPSHRALTLADLSLQPAPTHC